MGKYFLFLAIHTFFVFHVHAMNQTSLEHFKNMRESENSINAAYKVITFYRAREKKVTSETLGYLDTFLWYIGYGPYEKIKKIHQIRSEKLSEYSKNLSAILNKNETKPPPFFNLYAPEKNEKQFKTLKSIFKKMEFLVKHTTVVNHNQCDLVKRLIKEKN